jgi:hypothetical protein
VGLVRGKCGEPYTIVDYYRGKYPYYRCKTKYLKGKSECDNRNIRVDELDKVILGEVSDTIFSKENLAKYREVIDESAREDQRKIEHYILKLKKEKDELNRKFKVYYDNIENGSLQINLVAERL